MNDLNADDVKFLVTCLIWMNAVMALWLFFLHRAFDNFRRRSHADVAKLANLLAEGLKTLDEMKEDKVDLSNAVYDDEEEES